MTNSGKRNWTKGRKTLQNDGSCSNQEISMGLPIKWNCQQAAAGKWKMERKCRRKIFCLYSLHILLGFPLLPFYSWIWHPIFNKHRKRICNQSLHKSSVSEVKCAGNVSIFYNNYQRLKHTLKYINSMPTKQGIKKAPN